MARPVHLDPTHLPEYKCWGPTIWDVSQPIWFKICFLQSVIVHLIIMPKKQSWPPVISKRESRNDARSSDRGFQGTWTTQVCEFRGQKKRKKTWNFANLTGHQWFPLRKERGDGLGKDWRESLLCKPPHPPVSSGLQCSRASKYQVRFLKYEIM